MFNKYDGKECKECMKNRIRVHASEDIKPLTCTAEKERKCRREDRIRKRKVKAKIPAGYERKRSKVVGSDPVRV
jgi:hypothetical protein